MMSITIKDLSVLLVEPSSAQHRIIESYFGELGVTNIRWVQTGTEALHCLDRDNLHLVVSAMHLEDMTGTDLVLKIRTGDVQRNTPFMLISSETHYRYLEPIRQAGVIATLPKPFNQAQLEKSIYAVLDFLDPEELDLSEVHLEDFKVLLVDDSETSRRHVRNLLKKMGLENIDEVCNGNEALQSIESNFYDLIVTDYNMPEMDGKELVEFIRSESRQSSVPILMISCEHDERRLAAVRQAGVSAICDKPFDPSDIKRMIERIVG